MDFSDAPPEFSEEEMGLCIKRRTEKKEGRGNSYGVRPHRNCNGKWERYGTPEGRKKKGGREEGWEKNLQFVNEPKKYLKEERKGSGSMENWGECRRPKDDRQTRLEGEGDMIV